jgi:transcriptional regulator with XRE-family HTH domain
MRREDPDAVARSVGRRIAELRREHGLTQEKLAAALDVSVRWLARVELTGENLTIRTMTRIANGLRVPTRTLLDPPSPAAREIKRGRPKPSSNRR